MNRVTRILLVGLTAVGLLLAASPANAGSVSWNDDAGDATELGLAAGPLNDPAFDVTTVTIDTAGGKLVWAAEVPEMAEGTPDLSTGYNFRFGFTHAGASYWFQVGENLLGEPKFSLALTETGSPAMECKDCKGTIDRENKAVVVEAPLASLDAAFKAGEAEPATGSEWTTLFVIAQRPLSSPVSAPSPVPSGVTLTADTADAPEGTVLTI